MKLEVTDDDLDPSGPPFTFDILGGNEQNKFYIDRAGILSTAATFNRQIKDSYYLTIRVFDNGTPALYSDVVVNIQLVEESAFPPVISPMAVSVIAFNDEFPAGLLGRVKAHDPDPYDEISYSISSDNQYLFDIDILDGTLKALQSLDSGRYNITVSVTDGKFITNRDVIINVNNINPDMADNAVVMRFDAMTPADFVNIHKESFILSVASELTVRQNFVHILSLQPASKTPTSAARKRRSASSDLDVLVAVQKSNNKFYSSKKLRKNLEKSKADIERALNVDVLHIKNDVCEKDSCTNGACDTEIIFYEGESISIVTDTGSFVYPQYGMTTKCNCMPGFSGEFIIGKNITCGIISGLNVICLGDGSKMIFSSVVVSFGTIIIWIRTMLITECEMRQVLYQMHSATL